MAPHDSILGLEDRVSRSIIAQDAVVAHLRIALLADGHVRLEGLSGLAKTRTVKSMAMNLGASLNPPA